MPHERTWTDGDHVVGVGCPSAACCGPIYKADRVTTLSEVMDRVHEMFSETFSKPDKLRMSEKTLRSLAKEHLPGYYDGMSLHGVTMLGYPVEIDNKLGDEIMVDGKRRTYGAWDEPQEVDQATCKHNWLFAHYSNEFVCVRCGLREDAVMHRWVEGK